MHHTRVAQEYTLIKKIVSLMLDYKSDRLKQNIAMRE